MGNGQNRVSIDIEVTNEEKARAAFQNLKGDAEKFASDVSKVSADPFAELARGAKLSGEAVTELDRIVEASFVKSSRSVKSFGEETARGIQSAQRETLSLQRSFQQLSRSPFQNISTDAERGAARAFQLQQILGDLFKQQQWRPGFEINAELTAAVRKAETLRQELFGLQSKQTALGPTQQPTSGDGLSQFKGFAASLVAGQMLGGGAGEYLSIAGQATLGGPFAYLAAAGVAVKGASDLIEVHNALRKSQFELAVSTLDTGRSFAEAVHDSDDFRASLIANREEANKVAAAFGELQLRAGGALPPDAARKLSTIATGRGLTPEETEKQLRALAKGSKQAFESLTGRDADLAIERYAQASNRAAKDLTDVERITALTAAALSDFSRWADIATQRTDTLSAHWQRFKNDVSDSLSQEGLASILEMLAGGQGGPGVAGAAAYLRYGGSAPATTKPDAKAAADVQRKAEQQREAIDYRRHLEDLDRAFRTVPEDFGAGMTPLERQRAELDRLRGQRQGYRVEQQFLEANRGSYSSEGYDQFSNQLRDRVQSATDSIRQNSAQIEDSFRRLRAEGAELIDSLAVKVEHDNPFAKLAFDSDRAIEQIRLKFKDLSSDAVESLVRMQQAADDVARSNLKIQTSMKAVELEFQAKQLERGYIGITGEQQRQLNILQKQFDALKQAPDLRRQAEAFERGFVPQNDYQLAQEQRAEYERIKRLRPQGTDEAARAGQKLIDDYILERTKKLPIEAHFSPDAFVRQLADDRAGSLRASAGRFEAEIRDEIERARAGRAGVELAEKKLRELARLVPGMDEDALREQFLAITKGLDPKELTGALKQGLIAALSEEAKHTRNLEQKAQSFRAQLVSPDGILYQIKGAIEGLKAGDVAQSGGPSPAAAPGGEDYGPPVTVNQKYYPSKEAYEAAQGIQKPQGYGSPLAFFGPNLPFNLQNDPASAAAPSKDAALMDAFLRSKDSGRIVADFAAAFAPDFAPVGSPIEVNPFTQQFFRARPGYSPLNDPRSLDTSNPYVTEFYQAGYFHNVQSAGVPSWVEAEQKGRGELVGALNNLTGAVQKGFVTVEVKGVEANVLGTGYSNVHRGW